MNPLRPLVSIGHATWISWRVAASFALALSLSACVADDDAPSEEIEGTSQALAAAGSLDTSFGTAGKVRTPIDLQSSPRAVLQPDGKIVAAATILDGTLGNIYGTLRYTASGALDVGFGQAGVARTSFTDKAAQFETLALGADGKISLLGSVSYQVVTPSAVNNVTAMAFARLSSNGSLDATFGQGGKLIVNVLGKSDRATAALALAEGKLLVAGIVVDPVGQPGYSALRRLAVLRFNANGSLDTSFGQGGKFVGDRISGDPKAIARQADGSFLVLIGTSVTRLSASGAPLSVALSLPLTLSGVSPSPVAFQPDGKLIVPGTFKVNKHTHIIQMRRQALDGTLDATFNSPAFSYAAPVSGTSTSVDSTLVEPSGRVVVIGDARLPLNSNGDSAFGLGALRSDGPLDAAFGNGGTLTTTFTARDLGRALLRQSDGKILALGMSADAATGNSYALALARYLP